MQLVRNLAMPGRRMLMARQLSYLRSGHQPMHTSMTKSRHFGSTLISIGLLAAAANCADEHNHHSNDASEPVVVTLNVDATATVGGESNESAPSFGSYDHPIVRSDEHLLGASSQAGGDIMATGSANINASAQVVRTHVSDDFISWQVACQEFGRLSGGSASNPVSTSFDTTSTLWYTVDLQEAQDITLLVTCRSFLNFLHFDSEEETFVGSGNLLAWDGSEPSVSGPPTIVGVSTSQHVESYFVSWSWRISLPAGRWRLQAIFNGAHIHEPMTDELTENNSSYVYEAWLRPRTPSYLLPDTVTFLEQDEGMLTASTTSEDRSDTNSVNEYSQAVHAGLGDEYMFAPWAASDITATQHPLFWDDEGFYQILDAQARFGADTAHPFQTSTIHGGVRSEPALVMGSRRTRFEVSFSTEVLNEAWQERRYQVRVIFSQVEVPPVEIAPYWVSEDGRRFKFETGYGEVAIRPLIELEHSLTAQGWMVESAPHELVTMRVKFPIRADINNDGLVDGTDLATLLSRWGADAIEADLNDDGAVDGQDLAILLSKWS